MQVIHVTYIIDKILIVAEMFANMYTHYTVIFNILTLNNNYTIIIEKEPKTEKDWEISFVHSK